MKMTMFASAIALAAAACTHASNTTPAVAQVEGDQHVVVRAEAGRIWWQHRAWTEPHELWTLPSEGRVENLNVTRQGDAYVVSFEQGGASWSGSFGESAPQHRATQLAQNRSAQ